VRKGRLSILLCVVIGCFMVMPGATETSASVDLPEKPKRPHMVVDIETGEVISHEIAFARWAPASLTKMMTAYTVFRALELGHLDMASPVRISEEAIAQPPSKMGFPVGTILNIETALKIIMVKSANDISVALAEAASGSEERFVALMNSHARRLGMVDTQFANPHGLHDPSQYTSARDMVLLGMQLTREFPQYAEFFDIPAIRFGNRRLRNHNALLRQFEGTNGMKTGYVCASGFNVVVRTQRNGRSLLAVVMGEKSAFRRNVKAAGLLKKAFENKPGDGPVFNEFENPVYTSKEPYDITFQTCPFKYAALGSPRIRPPDAPSPQDFDGIDTQIIVPEGGLPIATLDMIIPPAPTRRPTVMDGTILVSSRIEKAHDEDRDDASNVNVDDNKEEGAKEPVEEATLSASELSKIYFKPVQNLRKDVRIALGGGTGLNPHGIKHTDGGDYQAPIPVPIKRPALDLKTGKE